MSSLRVQYETEDFPARSLTNGVANLVVSWNDVLWAAVTVGRPNRHYVFRHGNASAYEALFRLSLIRMALEQNGPRAYRLRTTNAAKTLDPTEKGAVNYFLGMTFCKLFAGKLLKTPWLLHFDVFRPKLNPVLKGRSRPDLIGQEHRTGKWHAFECKGRVRAPDATVKQNAKNQARRVVSVNGKNCSLHIGAITYLRNDVLQFYWRDPFPEKGNHIKVSFTTDAWRHYYAPVVELIPEDTDSRGLMQSNPGVYSTINGLDLELSIHPMVARFLFRKDWASARRAATEAAVEIAEAGYQPDGLVVRVGETWRERFEKSSVSEGSPEWSKPTDAK